MGRLSSVDGHRRKWRLDCKYYAYCISELALRLPRQQIGSKSSFYGKRRSILYTVFAYLLLKYFILDIVILCVDYLEHILQSNIFILPEGELYFSFWLKHKVHVTSPLVWTNVLFRCNCKCMYPLFEQMMIVLFLLFFFFVIFSWIDFGGKMFDYMAVKRSST